MKKPIYTALWFENGAKEAAEYYCGIFPNSRITMDNPMAVSFELNGQRFLAINGKNPDMKFNDSTSFVIECEDQAEIDNYWDKLTANGGRESQCGWCVDKLGVSWQVTPADFGRLILESPNAINAMMQMKKIIIADLK